MEDKLGDLFNKLIQEKFPPETLLLILVSEKVKKHGIKLTPNQRQDLTLHFQNKGADGLEGLKIELNRRQMAQLRKFGKEDLDLVIDDSDLDYLKTDLNELFSDVGIKTADYLVEKLVKAWKTQLKPMLKTEKSDRRHFTNYVNKVWGKPLDFLEALIGISLETGNDFREKYSPNVTQKNNYLFEALTRMHVRGCQVSFEILVLLRNGFADGAHARWRTLHEISVISKFIADHGNDLAEKYLNHCVITNYKDACQYRKHSNALSFAPMSDEEFEELKLDRDRLVGQYPKNFASDYGWASGVLGKENPNFEQIEESIGISFMRPFYKMANANVHAGSKGAIYRLGLPPQTPDLLVAGSSIYGLGDPGGNTSYSINLLTTTLLSLESNYDNLCFEIAYRELMEETVREFDKVENEAENF